MVWDSLSIAIAVVLGATLAFGAGYVLAIHVVSDRPIPWIVKRGIGRTFRDKEMVDYYDELARQDRQLYAHYVVQVLAEVGGPGAPSPRTREAWQGVYKLADHRMKEFRKRDKESPIQ